MLTVAEYLIRMISSVDSVALQEKEREYVYGPPIKTRHVCIKCGYKWTVETLGIDRAQFCPKCGGELNTESESNW